MDVLIVDDNPADRHLLSMIFSKVSGDVTTHCCSGGQQAMDFLYRRGANYDAPRPEACLLDINMPGMSGFDVLIAMKNDANLQSIPVFMFSSSDNDGDIKMSYENQAAGYIQKPAGLQQLEDVARSLTNYWTGIEKHPAYTYPFP